MTDTNTVTSPSECIILIDSRVMDYQDIINATQSGVQHLVFNVEDMTTTTAANPFDTILNRIAGLGVSSYSSIGLIQHNMQMPMYSMFGGEGGAVIEGVEATDPTLQTWAGVSGFITALKTTYGVQNFDLMACALYSDPNWKYIIDTLAVQTAVTIRASTDDTGAAALGGDWFLESHTGVNLKDVYFTEAIENFRGILVFSTRFDSRSYFSTKSIAVGRATAWGAAGYGGGTDINTVTGGVITSGVVALYSTTVAFAALKTNGSVSTWGASYVGTQTLDTGASVASSLTSGVVEIFTAYRVMAALKSDGTVVTWGYSNEGGNSTSVVLTNVVDIFPGYFAFSALKSNGSLVTWGYGLGGGDSSAVAGSLTSGVVSVNISWHSAAALKSNGSVITWGNATYGGNSSAVASSISSGVVVVYSDVYSTFAALKNNGTVVTWGSYDTVEHIAASSVTLTNIVSIYYNTAGAYAALNTNGGLITWGPVASGGDSSGKSLSSHVVTVCNNMLACAALKFDGSVVTWGNSTYGGNSTSVVSDLTSGVVAIYGNGYSFAALKSNGKVITWGTEENGGNSSSVATDISAGIVGIYASRGEFAALRNDGKLITWGYAGYGGNSSSVTTDLSAGIVSVNNTSMAFAAITSSATTFDLSMSYYRDIDRFNILRNKENRRRVNLTTLNNNVFTLSSERDVQKFNYTIPSGNSFRIIVPDYVSSNYSIISTATLPSDVSTNYIIACEEGEPVTISGVTYINYGAFVYRRNVADNTFTKMTSATIGGVSYNLYGGDGLFSSGIAFQYNGLIPTIGALSIPAKNFGDAAFGLTAPTSNSGGAFTYTSSNTEVATVTTSGTVTIAGVGTTTITATQASSGNYSTADVSGSLIVNFGNTNTITRLPTDGASVIPTPTSNISTTYGATWNQLGADIVGKVAGDESGTSISASADGTIVAIGARSNTSNRGTVRVYKYNDVSWNQLGSDINGEASSDYSGESVSLSANGRVVAIGANMNDGSGNLLADSGHARIYEYNGTSWVQRGGDIDGEANADQSGISVSLSEDGNIVAIGAIMNDGSGNALSNSGHVRVYKYNSSKSTPQLTDQSLSTFGPAGWDRLGGDIDGEAVNDQSGFSVSISADGTIVAIGAKFNDGTSGTADTNDNRGHVRVYRYNSSKTEAQLTNQGLTTFGPVGWDRMGSDIDGHSGVSSLPIVAIAGGSRSWYSISLSSTGQYQSAVTESGNIWTSSDYGASWSERTTGGSSKAWYSISLSSSGQYQSAGINNDGNIWTSSDFGVSWTMRTAIGQSISLSSTGQYQTAVKANGYIQTSSDYGVNWTQRSTYLYWLFVSLSSTGQYQSAVVYGGIIWTSSDYGVTWTSRATSLYWRSISLSSTGQYQSAVVYNGNIWTSSDYGASWSERTTGTTRAWYSVSLSSTGQYQSAVVNIGGNIWTSSDYGVTWTSRATALYWNCVSLSSTGELQSAVVQDGLIYFSRDYGVTWYAATYEYGSQFGTSVSLSADGTAVAIGSPLYGESGGFSGNVRVFAWNGSSWTQRGGTINDGSRINENFGDSVSLSADGNILSASSFMKVVNYNYNSSTNTWSQIGANITGTSSSVTNITNALTYSPHVYLDATRSSSYNGSTWTNIGSLGGSVIMGNMGTFDAADNGGSFNFNGSTNYGQLNIASSTVTSLTYVAVVKTTGLNAGWSTILDFGQDNVMFGTYLNIIRIYKPNFISGFTLTPGVWYVLAVTITTDRVFTFYVNGISIYSTVGPEGSVDVGGSILNTTNSVYGIGSGIAGPNEVWNGKISALAIYHNRVLTASEIANMINIVQYKVSLSSQGNIMAVGVREYDGTTGTSTNIGVTRVYRIDTSGNYTYTSNNTAIADVCGNIILPKSVGSTTIAVTQSASGATTSRSGTIPLSISGITPTIGALTVPAKNYADAAFDLTAPTSNSSGAFSYTSSDTAVATVTSGGTVTVVGVGSTTITATQDANGNYTGGSSVTASLVVSAIAPTIGTLTAPAKNFGDAAFDLTAPTSNSGGAFSYTSSNAAVATVTSGGTVTVVGAGTTTITATQAATTNYTGGSSVTASLVVSAIAPTIGTLTAPAKNFGDAAFDLTAPTSNSGGAFSYTSSNAAVATVTSGGTVTVVGAGTTTITATQAATTNYTGGSSVTASLVVSAIAPTYQSISQITKIYSTDVSFSMTSVMSGVSNSSGAYAFSSISAAIDICGGIATILAYTPSAITITASQAASGNYTASSKTFTLLVNRKTPSYGAFSVPAATYEDAPLSIVAYAPTTDSTGVPFTYTSSEPTVATINSDGTIVTIVGQGYTTITASQEAGGNYTASSITTSFLVNRAAPTFLKAFTIPNKIFGDASFSLLPFTEGLDNTDGTYHFTSSNAELVSISNTDNVTAFIHAYTPAPITIYVAIDACGNYAASSTSGTLTVARAAPTIGALTVPAKNFRDASFNLTAPTTDSSGAFSYTSSNTGVATVTSDGGVVSIVGAGSTTITATQALSGNYTTGSVTASLVVSPIAPTIGTLTAPAKNFGDASFNLSAPTTDSSGAFSYTSSNTSVATVTSAGGVVSVIGVGSTTITATQAATTNFTSGSVTASLVVSASLSNFTVPAKNYGAAAFDLTDPTSTDTTVGFTFSSGNTNVATIGGAGGRTVSIVGAGSTVITATQAATVNRGELTITATLVVSPIRPVITLAPITKEYGNSSFRLAPSSTNTDASGGSVFTFSSDNIAVVSFLDASLVRINGIGSATIAITQAASANFTDSSGSVVITVNKGASGFSASTFSVATNKTYGDANFSITTVPTSFSTGAITYSSSDTSVGTIDNNGLITLVGSGTVNFTASQAASALYNADTKVSNNLSVARKTAALNRDTPSGSTITKYYGNANFSVSATNESNGAFSFLSSDTSFATVNSTTGLVGIVGVGTTTITATRAQTAQYAETSVSWTLQIGRGTTTLSGLSSITRNVTVQPFTVTASSTSNGTVSYALQDPTSTVLTIHPTSGLVTLLSPGSAVIVASQAQGTLYEAPSDLTATITVTAAANTLQGATLTSSSSFANVNMNGATLTNSNITNTNFSSANLENANFSNSDISGANMTSTDLSGASLSTTNITNTNFVSARLANANFNNSTISGTNMTSADLSGATMSGSTITGTNFTSAILRRVDLSGSSVRRCIFNNADLSGCNLRRIDASGSSFVNTNLRGANLSNGVFTNADHTNANISGANISNVAFTVPQKLQLLRHLDNRPISELQVAQTIGSDILSVVSNNSSLRDVPNIANATFKVTTPVTTNISGMNIIDITLDTSNNTYFYFPINDTEYFRIQGIIYRIDASTTPPTVRNYETNAVVENSTYGTKAIRLIAGSLSIIVNSQNTLPTSTFVVPSTKITTDASFGITTAPTSNSSAPIVYASTNTSIATIHPSTGVITLTGVSGFVRFTASQAMTETHESASITSNELFVNKLIDLTLSGLNQTFSLSTLATLDASSVAVGTTDAAAVFYVRLSDMTELFQYQTDSFDINDMSSSDIKYYVFHRKWPTELRINPTHAMMDKTDSAGMLGGGEGYAADKSLVKHDFIRYIALRLFNTIHGVDLFSNEKDLHENLTYFGETVRNNIDTIFSGISTTSSNETMSYDTSGNKYLTNDASGNSNLCRELMRQIAAAEPSRFYNNGENNAGLKSVPLRENDSILFKLTIMSASGQNILTGVGEIPSRSYTIKLVLKNTVNSVTNANTVVSDSEMYSNSYAYSTAVTTYPPTSDSSTVYNDYSPPAPIPFSRFGYNGWYYTNSSAWVSVAPSVRDRVKWVVPANTVGSSTVAQLQYARIHLKVFNKTSLPYLVVYTQGGSSRKYTIASPNSLVNGTEYSFYMNFNLYARDPAMIGYTNAALSYSGVGVGSFANNEVVTSIAVETDSGATAASVEFTLTSVVVGEISSTTSLVAEKEYGFSADVPSSYP